MIWSLWTVVLALCLGSTISTPAGPLPGVLDAVGLGALRNEANDSGRVEVAGSQGERASPFPIRLPHHYKVPNSETVIRMGFGERITDREALWELLVICEHAVRELVQEYGLFGEVHWESPQRQLWGYDLGAGVKITVMNRANKVMWYGQLLSLMVGLKEYLVDQNRPNEVSFIFRCGEQGDVGWGWIVKERNGLPTATS
ncbi:MAG: hypothetical protein Q9183_000461 [Haloplaca sp. 2 TL-2023]